MSTQHTPGPWSVSETTDDGFCIPGVAYLMGVNAEANAEFIVRACNSHDDLLAALEAAPLPTVVGTAFREWYYGERQAAIAKAEEGS